MQNTFLSESKPQA